MKIFCNRVIDGDTIEGTFTKTILELDVKFTVHFRLIRIDAPEKTGVTKEAGIRSMEYLKGRIEGQNIKVKIKGRDKYGRWLAEIFKDGININDELVQLGFAVYRTY